MTNYYSFYAKPKDSNNLVMVTPYSSIAQLKLVLSYTGNVDNYDLMDEPLKNQCVVEEHHYYNLLRLNWLKIYPEGNWEDSNNIHFGFSTTPKVFIKGIEPFLNKYFVIKDFVNKLNTDKDFKRITELLFGNDIDYVDMYFDKKNDWSLTSVQYKAIRNINYKSSICD